MTERDYTEFSALHKKLIPLGFSVENCSSQMGFLLFSSHTAGFVRGQPLSQGSGKCHGKNDSKQSQTHHKLEEGMNITNAAVAHAVETTFEKILIAMN